METYTLAETLRDIYLTKLSLDTFIEDFGKSQGGIVFQVKLDVDEKSPDADIVIIIDVKLEGYERNKSEKINLDEKAFVLNIIAKAIYGDGNNKKEASLAFKDHGSAIVNLPFMWINERIDKCINDIGIRGYKSQKILDFSEFKPGDSSKKNIKTRMKSKTKKKTSSKTKEPLNK